MPTLCKKMDPALGPTGKGKNVGFEICGARPPKIAADGEVSVAVAAKLLQHPRASPWPAAAGRRLSRDGAQLDGYFAQWPRHWGQLPLPLFL